MVGEDSIMKSLWKQAVDTYEEVLVQVPRVVLKSIEVSISISACGRHLMWQL